MSKNPLDALPGNLGNSLGDYLREQRLTKKLSVRQLSALAGISNPYLSQIERGVKRPSAEILQQIARGLSISAESLYVQAGLLDPKDAAAEAGYATRAAIGADPALTSRQRQTLLDIYESFVGDAPTQTKQASSKKTTGSTSGATKAARSTKPGKTTTARRTSAATKGSTHKKAATKKAATTKKATPSKKTAATKKAAQKTTAGQKPAARTKGSTRTSGSTGTSAPRAARTTPTSSSTSTSRRSS